MTPCKWITPSEETDGLMVKTTDSREQSSAIDVHSEDFSLIPSEIPYSPSGFKDDASTSSTTLISNHCASTTPTVETHQTNSPTETLNSKSIGIQTNLKDSSNHIDMVCSKCSQSGGIEYTDTIRSQPPSPMTILKTMESKKLKAYKKTVNLLKKKLSEADIQISDLQAQLTALTPRSNSSDTTGELIQKIGDSVDDRVVIRSDILETEKNDKYIEEIKLLEVIV